MGEWIEHDGSEWPKHAKPEDSVIVRFKDGVEGEFPVSVLEFHGFGDKGSSNWYWDPRDNHMIANLTHIVAYKVVSDDPSKAP